MKPNMKSFLIGSLLLLLCGETVSPIRVFSVISMKMDWYEAQKYCRDTNQNLATISSTEEKNRLMWPGSQTPDGWIGLKRTKPLSNTWQWSDGQNPTFFQWAENQEPAVTSEDCVILTHNGWITSDCSGRWPVFCYKNMTLMKEKKTWEEALEHCRSRNTTLVSLTWELKWADKEAAEAPTGSVWMGLHSINGKWLRLSGKEAKNMFSPYECPAPPYRCGARDPTRRVWEIRDCNEKLNFLCY